MEDLSSSLVGSPRPRLWRSVLFVVAISAGCSNFIGTTARSFMTHIESDPDPNKRYLAYAALGKRNVFDNQEQKAQAVQLLLKKLEEGKEPLAIRAVICRTLGELREPAARPALIKTIGHEEGILRAEACRAIGKIGNTDDASMLARVMTIDVLEDCRMAAIEGLGEMKANDPRVITILIDGMEHDDPAIRMASLTSLRKISGKDLGVEPGPWRKHYEAAFAQASRPITASGSPPDQPAQAGVPQDSPKPIDPSKKVDPEVVKSQRR